MEQPAQPATPCPLCGIPLVCLGGKIPSHGRRVREGIGNCDAAVAGKYFERSWAKPVNKEKRGK